MKYIWRRKRGCLTLLTAAFCICACAAGCGQREKGDGWGDAFDGRTEGKSREYQNGQKDQADQADQKDQNPLSSYQISEEKKLIVYTSHKEEVYGPIIREFEERTGIWVQVRAGGTTELLEAIAGEAGQQTCDVMFGGGVESYDAYREYFMPYQCVQADVLDQTYSSAEGCWTVFSELPIVFIYNNKLVNQEEIPLSWSEFLTDKWKGRIAFADPGMSGTSCTALATMLQVLTEGAGAETAEGAGAGTEGRAGTGTEDRAGTEGRAEARTEDRAEARTEDRAGTEGRAEARTEGRVETRTESGAENRTGMGNRTGSDQKGEPENRPGTESGIGPEEREILAQFAKALDGNLSQGSGQVLDEVASGTRLVGITLEESARKRMALGADISMVYPEEGTSAVPDGSALVKNAPHEENGKLFMDFTVSEDVQKILVSQFYRRSVRKDLNLDQEESGPKIIEFDLEWASDHQQELLETWSGLTE